MPEFFLIVLVPTVDVVWLRTRFPSQVSRLDFAWPALGSVLHLVLLLAVVGPNGATIIGYGCYAIVIALAALTLNLIGYAVGMTAKIFTKGPDNLEFHPNFLEN
ncbi:hypothetical protein [Pseudosulfitobacter koreensis]|uniref:Uncharacterized protein n=1 Tax=Pseudosulfitobacter koreensis TaxID=2968472 RepID=A0ABT1YWK3_9RHOB|nr:hypothetical protein [Pseudosulfitobacter koreense]MCR8825270.1 hypothetical protein [Pseudosulfitobacter koreense]